ncbi:CapA family protein [Nocardioides sediminis]|uniref:CapA family protein n=1 Tax=Nocardioides sediminis TaxID=433648 RepID=UPI00131F30EE|nr:CapA family protein [Nocardioides sediminis]
MASRAGTAALGLAVWLALAACTVGPERPGDPAAAEPGIPASTTGGAGPDEPSGEVTLAFAGDVHFEEHLTRLLEDPRGALGPMAGVLREADLAMLNLESAITERGRRDPKELEDADNRYHFRTSPRALEVLADAGVDVVSVANNHVGDYGRVGLADTLRAGRDADVALIGIGRDEPEALTPHRVTENGVDLAFLAADSVFREGSSDVWAAGPDSAGVAAARRARPAALLRAVRSAAEVDDVVVVYLHWGRERQSCPTQKQRLLGRQLAEAGADVVVGSHSHVLGGAGWSGDTYVGYGLGNFVWYHDRQPDTGVLSLRVDRDGVVDAAWEPALIAAGGRPRPLAGSARGAAVDQWVDLQRCTGLAEERGGEQAADPAYASSVRRIGPALAERMRTSHRPGCPVPLRDLRYLRMTHRDYDGRARTGEMVVHRRYARDVTRAFGRLYDVGFPIRRMRLVDDYDGDDDRSMAANNTSGFNCRRVAGQAGWSDHAYGAAIDVNPIQNPYVRPGSVVPPSGRGFARIDRSTGALVPAGVIRVADPVVEAFARIGWDWGGYWVSSKDYQHLAARDAR